MPEGDTVRRLADRITQRFAGAIVERSIVRDPRLVGVDLTGRMLVDADAYGKHLFVRFDGGRSLHAHLLMTGGFAVGPRSTESEWRRRIELWFGDGRLTGEAVPILGMIPTSDEHVVTGPLGPDLCRPAIAPDPDEVADRMRRAPDAPLAGAMLDQHHAAGWGNVYTNDVPFIVGVSPFQPVATIDGLADLAALGTALIRTNAARGIQNTTGRRLDRAERWLHGAGRRPCPICGTRLDRRGERDSPWGRATTWCPTCQPEAGSATVDLVRARRSIALHPAIEEPYLSGR